MVIGDVWRSRGRGGVAGAHEVAGRRANGDDRELVAPPGMVGPAVTTPVAMPTSASRGSSQLSAHSRKLIASSWAKLKTPPHSSYKFLLVCNLV